MKLKTTILCLMFLLAINLEAKQSYITNLNNKFIPFYTYQGDVFAAVQVPKNIQTKIQNLQNQISHSLEKSFSPAPLSNLHITLQLIGQVNDQKSIIKIHNVMKKVAANHKQWNLAKHLINTKLSINKDGIVKLQLPRSDSLTALATDARQFLNNAKISYKSRFDFPDNAHITIGKVDPKNVNALRTKLKNSQKQKIITVAQTMKAKNFHVKNFVLLKSNNPNPNRKYTVVSSYELMY